MPRYLVMASYSHEGAKGVLQGGGSARRAAVEKALAPLGGRMVSFDFAFGPEDVYTIVELPDQAAAVALALNVNADGRTRVKTAVLITPEEVDEAAKRDVAYQGPGAT